MSQNIDNNENNDIKQISIEDKILLHQNNWTERVQELSKQLKTIPEIKELMNKIYSERQLCVDYYYTLMNMIAKQNKSYKVKYAKRFNFYKTQSDIRYNSDAQIVNQINADLSEDLYINNLLESHFKFMGETLKTIDNIIYGINNRIKLEELIIK